MLEIELNKSFLKLSLYVVKFFDILLERDRLLETSTAKILIAFFLRTKARQIKSCIKIPTKHC